MTTPETDPQPEPPTGGLVQNEGVDAGEDVGQDASTAAARSGGRPEDADAQLESSAGQDQMTDQDDPDDESGLLGSPDPHAEAGGQDSGSID